MTDFLKYPFCPERKISLAFIGKAPKEITSFIEGFGIELITVNSNEKVDNEIQNHCDVSIFHFGDGNFVIDTDQEEIFKKFSCARGAETVFFASVSGSYPNDCKLNFALVGNKLIGKMSMLDENIKQYAIENGLELINVNQGYAKCSTCIVNESSIITDDLTIHKATKDNEIKSLLIEKGDIVLSDKHYGFIGGASCLIDKNHLLFFGDIRMHRSFALIEKFLAEQNCRYSFIVDYPLTDIGGIVAIA